MRLHVRIYVAIAGGLLAIVVAAPAHAGSLTTTNACLYSVNGEYRDQAVKLSGVGSPRDAAAGATATLSGASITAALPASLPETGYDLGIFKAGLQPDPLARLGGDRRRPRDPGDAGPRAQRDRLDDDQGQRRGRASSRARRSSSRSRSRTRPGRSPAPARSPSRRPARARCPACRSASTTRSSPSPAASSSSRSSPTCASSWTASPARPRRRSRASPRRSRRRSPTLEADVPVVAGKPKARIASTKLKRLAARVGVRIACPAGSVACKRPRRAALRAGAAARNAPPGADAGVVGELQRRRQAPRGPSG